MTAAAASETPAPPAGRWFGPVRPLPRWPLRIAAAALALVVYKALEADLYIYVYDSYNSDVPILNVILLGFGIWAVVRILKSLLSGKRRLLRFGFAITDVVLAIEAIRQLEILTIGVFAAHVALFHPCDKFGPATRLGDCVDRNGGTQGTFILYDPKQELLRQDGKRTLAWKIRFDTIAFGHDISVCRRVATLGSHIFLVHCE